jgi:hypothetical protein
MTTITLGMIVRNAEEILEAFRFWVVRETLEGFRLTSLRRPSWVWPTDRDAEAGCDHGCAQPPQPACLCGLYAGCDEDGAPRRLQEVARVAYNVRMHGFPAIEARGGLQLVGPVIGTRRGGVRAASARVLSISLPTDLRRVLGDESAERLLADLGAYRVAIDLNQAVVGQYRASAAV